MSAAALTLGFGLGAAFGAAAQAGRFCLLRGLKGLRRGGDLSALRAFALAMAVALLASQMLDRAGLTDLAAAMPRQAGNPWPSILFGGALFGLGMAVANGCGARALVLLGSGNLRSLLVLLCLGLAAQATLTGVLAPLRAAVQAIGGPVPRLAGQGAAITLVALLLVLILAAFAAPLLRRHRRDAAMAAVIGVAVAAGWAASFAADDPFDPRPLNSISFVGPVGETLLWSMLATGRAAGLGVAIVGGTLAGALTAALGTRSFRAEGFRAPAEMLRAAAGGLLMGFGGVLALGCSIGQGLSGVSTLAPGSFIALAGIALGALGGLAIFPSPLATGARP